MDRNFRAGNHQSQEEKLISNVRQSVGNRISAIAARISARKEITKNSQQFMASSRLPHFDQANLTRRTHQAHRAKGTSRRLSTNESGSNLNHPNSEEQQPVRRKKTVLTRVAPSAAHSTPIQQLAGSEAISRAQSARKLVPIRRPSRVACKQQLRTEGTPTPL